MENNILEKEVVNDTEMKLTKRSKLLYIIPLLSLIFPIVSIEGLVPWTVAIYFCYKGISSINKYEKPLKKCISYLVLSGVIIALYNILVYFVSNYLVKLLM
ncbi:hypothetical protein [Clostridium folliculivorans]|uniref:Uncharacterized protein n=1 Tax=Clostridium folliculivorans TaxID=2886038 RepID=A0A9W5XZN1_9CLOT|nr:hypothetical protein [Clostridium folliculivorans]GKU23875.1 hypothetical protein CFOLD11_07010 [Clostridium folliculivorans]GKU29991.1 hypothetical protein CFB3_20980 [Clostridium folliculivorans]